MLRARSSSPCRFTGTCRRSAMTCNSSRERKKRRFGGSSSRPTGSGMQPRASSPSASASLTIHTSAASTRTRRKRCQTPLLKARCRYSQARISDRSRTRRARACSFSFMDRSRLFKPREQLGDQEPMKGRIWHVLPGLQERKCAEGRARRIAELGRESVVKFFNLVEIACPGDKQESERDQQVAVAFLATPVGEKLFQQQASRAWQRNGNIVNCKRFSWLKHGEMTEHQERQLIILEHVRLTRARPVRIQSNKVHLDKIRSFGQPDRGLFFGTCKSSNLMEPRLDGSVTIDGNRDINVLGDNERGSRVRLQQIRHFRTRDQNSRFS